MNTWPAWTLENAPPPLDGARGGSNYRTDYPRPVVQAARAPVNRPAPAPEVAPVQNTPQIAEQPPVEEQARLPAPSAPVDRVAPASQVEKTLQIAEQSQVEDQARLPVTDRPESGEATLAALPKPAEPAPAGPSDTAPVPAIEPAPIEFDNIAAIDAAPIDNAPRVVPPTEHPPMIEASPQVDEPASKQEHEVKLERQGGAIILEFSDSESNLPAPVEKGPSVVGGIAKHLAIMGGTIPP